MKAVLRDAGRTSGVRLADLAEPGRPGPEEVLVRMLMAPVNPADRLAIAGRYQVLEPVPEILGAEGVGLVEDRGPGVTSVEAGDRVILMSRGNWAGRRLVPEADVLPVPAALPDPQAAMLRINPATAWRLIHHLRLGPGEGLIQNAAGSSVARWVRLINERRGIKVLNVGRPGAEAGDAGFLADGEDLAERATAAAGGHAVTGALDAVAGAATGRLAACLGPGGRILVYGHLSGEPCSIPSRLLTTRRLQLSGFSLRPDEAGEAAERRASLYAELAEISAQSPEPIAAVFAVEEIEAALEAASARGRHGRILLALEC